MTTREAQKGQPGLTRAAASFVRKQARTSGRSFEEIATAAAKRFGARAPDSTAIANLIGAELRGKASLNRFRRDGELARWVWEHRHAGTIKAIHTACVARFGAVRAPSRTCLATHLQRLGRDGRNDGIGLFDRDQEVRAWICDAAHSLPLESLLNACRERFGEARTPNAAAASRFLRRRGLVARGRKFRLAADPELAEWVTARAATHSLQELHSAVVERFGEGRGPALSSIQRFLASLKGRRPKRLRANIDRDAELATWLRARAKTGTLASLVAGARAEFGQARAPSMSALHRFFQRHRLR